MSRLSATLRLDVQLQARNKIYLIIGLAQMLGQINYKSG